MPDPIAELLNPARLLFDLQRGDEIAQSISGCLEPAVIANRVTDGLVQKFNSAFARIWLLEPEKALLRLVASSGMYTHINGSFATVAMGAYKVGKIAQNQVSFLSNNLADEPWVGNREWAIANNMRGFAGYPLAIQGRVIGVLATFSHQALEPEFLEVLQPLCTMVTIALAAALEHQQEKQTWAAIQVPVFSQLPLSEQLASILHTARLTLVGTEQPLPLSLTYVFLQAAEKLNRVGCAYCRLIYTVEAIALEAIISASNLAIHTSKDWAQFIFGELAFAVSCLGGVLQTQMDGNQTAIQTSIRIPRSNRTAGERLQIQCAAPVLQMAFTHLAFLAEMTVCDAADETVPLLTEDKTQVQPNRRVLWVQTAQAVPKGIKAKVDLSVSPEQLRGAVAAVACGRAWGIEAEAEVQQPLSERELEMMTLLAQGLRDRDIANHLIISESTVKFHINNILTKLKAKTRYQALHQVVVNGWI